MISLRRELKKVTDAISACLDDVLADIGTEHDDVAERELLERLMGVS